MKTFSRRVLCAISMGILGAVSMDLWSVILHVIFHLPYPNYALAGRWVLHVFLWGPGTLFSDVHGIKLIPHELISGWLLHYGIAIVYSFLYLFIVVDLLKKKPRLLSALLFAAVMIVVPFFIEQPALGMGIAASHTPNPAMARLITFSYHMAFGLGLSLGCFIVRRFWGDEKSM